MVGNRYFFLPSWYPHDMFFLHGNLPERNILKTEFFPKLHLKLYLVEICHKYIFLLWKIFFHFFIVAMEWRHWSLNYDSLWGKILMKILESTKKHFSDLNAKSQYSQSILSENGIVSWLNVSIKDFFGASTWKGICVGEEHVRCIPWLLLYLFSQ